MGKILLVLLSISILPLCIIVDAEISYVGSSCDEPRHNTHEGSIYEDNLHRLSAKLISKTASLKFYNDTAGDAPNQAYGFYQCREDIDLLVCNSCINDATTNLLIECPLSVGGVAFFYECTLRYSNSIDMFSTYKSKLWLYGWGPEASVSNYTEFARILSKEIDGVISNASLGIPHFAASAASVANYQFFEELYTFAQCTPVIDGCECNRCLQMLRTDMSNGSRDAMMFRPNCQLRYDMAPIISSQMIPAPPPPTLGPPPPLSPPPSNIVGTDKKPKLHPAIVGAIAGGLFLVAVVLGICLCFRKPKKGNTNG